MNPSAPFDPNSFLVIDDEYEHIEFLPDFLRSKGFTVDVAANAEEALTLAGRKRYRAYIVDLNIPLGAYSSTRELRNIQEDYVGLQVIQAIRTQGISGGQVVAYSAHENEAIKAEILRLYCRYIVKGRVKDLKDFITSVINRAPK